MARGQPVAPQCSQSEWEHGCQCSSEARRGLAIKGTVRWYCWRHFVRWKRLYDDLETEYRVVVDFALTADQGEAENE